MKRKIRILLADDHLVVRMGLAAIIGIEKDFELAGEAGNGQDAVRLAAELNPDVIIMDLMMPRMDGVRATEKILKENPDRKILILTTFGASEDIRRALDAGAIGAMVKDSAHAELIGAIHATARGERTLSPAIRSQLKTSDSAPSLTPRQLEILSYVAKGLNNREIAPLIGIGPDCVKARLKTAFARLGAASRSEAVALAVDAKLITV
ncbi:MAG: response regulator transcription factor [bacterium]|nr:response regulator transcription factor [Candidatus Colisoma equi]